MWLSVIEQKDVKNMLNRIQKVAAIVLAGTSKLGGAYGAQPSLLDSSSGRDNAYSYRNQTRRVAV